MNKYELKGRLEVLTGDLVPIQIKVLLEEEEPTEEQAICGDQRDGDLYSAARAIAENEFVLSAIRQQKIVVIERLKEASPRLAG